MTVTGRRGRLPAAGAATAGPSPGRPRRLCAPQSASTGAIGGGGAPSAASARRPPPAVAGVLELARRRRSACIGGGASAAPWLKLLRLRAWLALLWDKRNGSSRPACRARAEGGHHRTRARAWTVVAMGSELADRTAADSMLWRRAGQGAAAGAHGHGARRGHPFA